MKQIQVWYHRLLASARYHSEQLNLIPKRYPKRIVQTELESSGILFDVHNLTEVNRVVFFDDEEDFLSDLLKELSSADVFFDIGACIGVFSLHAAKHCKQVIAFEPEPGLNQHLIRNVEINGFRNVMVLPYAIADRSSSFLLFTNGTDGKSPSLDDDGFNTNVEVEARTLSELVYQNQIPMPSIIKMDIEGAEILALKGMEELFAKDPPRSIYLELHPVYLNHFNSSAAEVLSLLRKAGYQIKKESKRDQQIHFAFELDSARSK